MDKKILITAIITLLLGAGGGYWLASQGSSMPSATKEHARKALFYRNPMNPEVTSPVPTKDNMGMDYVAVYDDGDNSHTPVGTVKINPTVVQNIGV
ncbi:MAG: efflux transporter periplasmic adaptor subunit, partial [Mariprofundaceae bacterium]|nr:efflux transporter periplasmic adaptor subunit [Mariprofundaceae bacterium]